MAGFRWSWSGALAIACVLGAVALIVGGFEHGWGWLLVLAFLVSA